MGERKRERRRGKRTEERKREEKERKNWSKWIPLRKLLVIFPEGFDCRLNCDIFISDAMTTVLFTFHRYTTSFALYPTDVMKYC